MKRLTDAVSQSPWYWLTLILLGLTLEGVALFYQHVLNEPPCQLCIHVRLWVFGLIVVGLLGLLLRSHGRGPLVGHVLVALVAGGLLERAYRLLGIEQGFLFSECSMESGFPSWLALDVWMPALFQAESLCGLTPILPLGISMAEALFTLALLLLGFSLTAVWVRLRTK